MAAITICSDFGAPKIKSLAVFIASPSICHEVMGPDALILVFWTLSFKPTFSLSYFIKRLSISSLFYAITVVSSAYLRLLSKMHCCYIIISTDLKEKHTFEQDELCYLIISYGLKKISLKNCCYNISEFKQKVMWLRQSNVE